jgi:hypothetical protein
MSFKISVSAVRAAIAKPLFTESNAQMRKGSCHDHKAWIKDDLKYVIYADESSSFTLFPSSQRFTVWRAPKETYKPKCLVLIEVL